MKKYNNIPLKERNRNADRVYRHEVRLEEIQEKRLIEQKNREMEEMIREKYRQENEGKTDKDREFEWVFAEIRARFGEESEDTE